MSTNSAGLAKKMGYKNIRVMLEGAPAWKKSGSSLVASQKFIEKGNIVLVDLRSEKEVKKGHIPRAVNIPMEDLEDAEDDFPSNMSAPLVFYGNGNNAEKADKMARKWGYKKTSIVPGGFAAWVHSDKKIARGPAADEIDWVRKLGPGEVSVADFKKSIGNQTSGSVILDVRTNDEADGGKFADALHIPLDEVETRMAELPKDKEILIHCSTGARAEMAYNAIKKAGLKSRYCVATVECEAGKCEISE